MARWVPQASKVRRRCGEALSLFERIEMSGSEFERENIVAEALSATAASKPADTLLEDSPREHNWRPKAEGLYDPSLEKDSCGVGFIANIKGKKSHQIVSDAINILCNLEHRGAVGADPRAGDGAGILVQIPHAFFSRKAAEIGFQLPEPGHYAIGALFMPKETAWRKVIQSIIAEQIKEEGLHAARLARRADRQFLARRNRQADRTRQHAGVHRPQRHREDRGRVRAQALHPAQVDLAGDLSAPRARAGRLLPGLDVVPHRDLQGHVPRRPARQVLSRPARSGFRERAGAGASALLDQHLPGLVAGASLPHDRP